MRDWEIPCGTIIGKVTGGPALSEAVVRRRRDGRGTMRLRSSRAPRGRARLMRPLFNASLFSNPRLLRWRSEGPASAVGPQAFESRGSLISVDSFGAPVRLDWRGVSCTHRRFH